MKKLGILLCLSTFVLAAPVFGAEKAAAQPAQKSAPLIDKVDGQSYGMAGCGLGSIVFGDKPGMIQIASSILNNWFFPQSSAITSGTSNCVDTPGTQASAQLFITANREALEKDISRGNGETLSNLSQIMGCDNSSVFGSKLQSNYGKIFPSASVSTETVVDSIMNTVESDSQLSKSCSFVG